MKKLLILSSIFLFIATSLNAQDWKTDLNDAKKIASEKNNPIVLVFQGSDWCAPCIKLDTQIFSTQEFTNYAKDHYVMLKADFPKKSKNKLTDEQQEKNDKLAEKYNPNGYFPYVVVLDKTGKVLGNTGYKNISPAEYIKILNTFK